MVDITLLENRLQILLKRIVETNKSVQEILSQIEENIGTNEIESNVLLLKEKIAEFGKIKKELDEINPAQIEDLGNKEGKYIEHWALRNEEYSKDTIYALALFYDLDARKGTSIVPDVLTDDTTKDVIDVGAVFLMLQDAPIEYVRDLYEKTKNNLSSKNRCIILFHLKDKALAEEALQDPSLVITPEQKIRLIGITGSHELATEYYRSKEYKDFIEKHKQHKYSDDARFMAALLNDDSEKLVKFLLSHRRELGKPFIAELADIIANQDPRYMKLLCDGRISIASLSFEKRLEYRSKVYSHKKRRFNIILLNLKPNDRRVEKVALTQRFPSIGAYYINYNNLLSPVQKTKLLRAMYMMDREETLRFISERIKAGELFEPLNTSLKALGIKREDVGCHVLRSNSLLDISVEELEKRNDVDYIEIPIARSKQYYSRGDFIKIRKAYEELFGDIPQAETGNPKSEYEVFKMVAKRIMDNIEYDHFAISKKGEKDSVLQDRMNSFYNALVEKKCVCGGFARLLELALNDKGVKCKAVAGFCRTKHNNKRIIRKFKIDKEYLRTHDMDYESPEDIAPQAFILFSTDVEERRIDKFLNKHQMGHAWNQVTIGEHTFNYDILYYNTVLYNDEDFNRDGLVHYRTNKNEEYNPSVRCNVSFEEAFPELVEKKKRLISLKAIRDFLKRLRRDQNTEDSEEIPRA